MSKGRQTISLGEYNNRGKNTDNPRPNQNNRSTNPPRETKTGTAAAPYNFVSLPEKILPSEIERVEDFAEHISIRGKISGEILLELETLTPLFIGGNPSDGTKTFAPTGTPIIPGSSLRGMFKNIFKIVTCGAFRGRTDSQRKGEDFNDEHIYFRCLMKINALPWTRDLNALYKNRMESLGRDGKPHKNARPGFLIRTVDNKFFIAPLLPNLERKNDFIMIKDFQKNFGPIQFKDSRIYWDGKIAYCLTGNQWAKKTEKLLSREEYEKFKDSLKGLPEAERTKKIHSTNHGKQIIRYTKIDYVDWSREHWLELPDDVRTSYEHDRNRRGVNLFQCSGILSRAQLKELVENLPAEVKTLVPCHFLEEGGKVTAFGHGQCFRIPYRNPTSGAVTGALNDTGVVDFADAVFGREKFWASRVYFENAVPVGELRTLEKSAAHPLMQPNPTSYQLYLAQNPPLNHWDSPKVKIRGYKMYWHCGFADWHATDAEKNLDVGKAPEKRMTKDLTPLAKGAKFRAKIRFKNLSAVELGALMMVFDLNGAENPAYKIGQGKPLGFGSVKITPQLFVESDDAYAEIFDAAGWKNPYRAEDAAEYLDAFKNYLAEKNLTSSWQKIMGELNAILDWAKKPAAKKIEPMRSVYDGRTMQVDERFRQREVLPTIFEVVK